MYQQKNIAVVVPAYNEEALIQKTLASIPAWVDSIIVVDDASQDSTSQKIQMFPRGAVYLEQHTKNQGVGAAISTGYRRALALGADIAVVMAGDAQMDPADLQHLLAPLVSEETDYAKGNRLAHPSVFRTMPPARLAGTFLLALMTRPISGFWKLQDSQCGYTAISRRALLSLDLDSLYPRYGYPNDLLVQLGTRKLRSLDVPVRPVYGTERSGFRPLTVAPRIAFVLARALAYKLRDQWQQA
jgi:glycosyltransferase involved in cell wall biosynthesis